jgi:hypothetical protein
MQRTPSILDLSGTEPSNRDQVSVVTVFTRVEIRLMVAFPHGFEGKSAMFIFGLAFMPWT